MVGPSASGSLNGTPTSRMSETRSAARSASRLAPGVGWPAVRYGMSALRRASRSADQTGASLDSDKVIADRQPIARRIGHLHDRATVRPALVLLGQVHRHARRGNAGAVDVHRDPDQRPVELLALRVGGGDNAHLERIQDDTGADR